jgi:hypothetical protein
MIQQINLFNPIFLRQKKYFSAVTMAQGLGAILLGATVLAGYARYQLYELGKEAESTRAQLTSVQAQQKKMTAQYAPKQKDKQLEAQIGSSEVDANSLLQVFSLLDGGDLGNTKGYAEYMRAFSRQIVQGVWLTGFQIRGAGHDIALQGRALQPDLVPAYISRLRNEPVLQGRSFAALEMQASSAEAANSKGVPGTVQRVSMPSYIGFELRTSDVAKEVKESKEAKTEQSSDGPAPYAQAMAYLEFHRALAELRDKVGSITGAKGK